MPVPGRIGTLSALLRAPPQYAIFADLGDFCRVLSVPSWAATYIRDHVIDCARLHRPALRIADRTSVISSSWQSLRHVRTLEWTPVLTYSRRDSTPPYDTAAAAAVCMATSTDQRATIFPDTYPLSLSESCSDVRPLGTKHLRDVVVYAYARLYPAHHLAFFLSLNPPCWLCV